MKFFKRRKKIKKLSYVVTDNTGKNVEKAYTLHDVQVSDNNDTGKHREQCTIRGDNYELGQFHRFRITPPSDLDHVFAEINFQKGPIKEYGINGCLEEDLIYIVLCRLIKLQDSRFKLDKVDEIIPKLEEVLAALKEIDKGEDNDERVKERLIDNKVH